MSGAYIVSDSSCDLEQSDTDSLNVEIVPLSIRFGNEEFTDLWVPNMSSGRIHLDFCRRQLNGKTRLCRCPFYTWRSSEFSS